MGSCALFWILSALFIGAAAAAWFKSPRPYPVPAGGENLKANFDGKVRKIFLYLVGMIVLLNLYFYLREGKPSDLIFTLALAVYLAYSYAYTKRPPSRSVEVLAILAILALFEGYFYLSICLGR